MAEEGYQPPAAAPVEQQGGIPAQPPMDGGYQQPPMEQQPQYQQPPMEQQYQQPPAAAPVAAAAPAGQPQVVVVQQAPAQQAPSVATGPSPQQCFCAKCNTVVTTQTTDTISVTAWMICVILCAFGFWCCSFCPLCCCPSDVIHKCPQCGTVLGRGTK